jgi:hypothetical protein
MGLFRIRRDATVGFKILALPCQFLIQIEVLQVMHYCKKLTAFSVRQRLDACKNYNWSSLLSPFGLFIVCCRNQFCLFVCFDLQLFSIQFIFISSKFTLPYNWNTIKICKWIFAKYMCVGDTHSGAASFSRLTGTGGGGAEKSKSPDHHHWGNFRSNGWLMCEGYLNIFGLL